MRLFKRLALAVLLLVPALAVVVVINTWRSGSQQIEVAPVRLVTVDSGAAAQRLSAAIGFRTISSHDDAALNAGEFAKLHALLEKGFPRVHATLRREVIGGASLLFTWPGSDPSASPIALMAHQDVVPIASGTEKAWDVEPFSGQLKDGFVWGRGAWDDKSNLMSQMEAVELLLASGFRPRQTIYLVMGHDEEVEGQRGSKAVAQLLKSRGVRLDFVIDEGPLVSEGIVAGVDKPVAVVGLAEKGFGTFHLSLDVAPGHSSMPPASTAIGMMGTALSRLEQQQLPGALAGVAASMFEMLAPEMPVLNRVLLSNLWLFRPLVKSQLEKVPSINAMLRTTTALTIFDSGNKDNVLPGHAEATVNFRLIPGDSLAAVEAHVRQVIANDAIKVRQQDGNSEPSGVSPTQGPGYLAIHRSVREVFSQAVVVPGLMSAATDSRHFSIICDNIYRFSPVRARAEDLSRFHGTNERISVANYTEMIQFYHQLMRNLAGSPSAV